MLEKSTAAALRPGSIAALTIAGSDSGGGAGIQADVKTFSALGLYGASAITALTAQNTLGVRAVHAAPPAMVAAQIEAVFEDLDLRAVKIGMLFSAPIARIVAQTLQAQRQVPIVLDPVMIATSGAKLIEDDAVAAIVERLVPGAACVTPNLAEAAFLTQSPLAQDEAEMAAQGRALLALGARAVLVKGGHGGGEHSVDLLVRPEGVTRFAAPRIATKNTHGTGCTLSAAIAARLALGDPLESAVGAAKTFLSAAIAAGQHDSYGKGPGPVRHFHRLWPLLEGG